MFDAFFSLFSDKDIPFMRKEKAFKYQTEFWVISTHAVKIRRLIKGESVNFVDYEIINFSESL